MLRLDSSLGHTLSLYIRVRKQLLEVNGVRLLQLLGEGLRVVVQWWCGLVVQWCSGVVVKLCGGGVV